MLNTSVPFPEFVAVEPICMLAQTAVAEFTVKVFPLLMMIMSEEDGNPPIPEPVVIALQLVLDPIVIVTPLTLSTPTTRKNSTNRVDKRFDMECSCEM